MPVNYEKNECEKCGHAVMPGEYLPEKPLVRNQDGSVVCVECMSKQETSGEKPLL